MRVRKLPNFLIYWHEIQKKNHQEIEKIRKRNMQQENEIPHPKHEYSCKCHSFFTLFQNLRLKSRFSHFFTKKVIFGKK